MSSGLLVNPRVPPVPEVGHFLRVAHDLPTNFSDIKKAMVDHAPTCGCPWDQIRRRLQPESDGLLPTVAHLESIRRLAVVCNGASGSAVIEGAADGLWTLTARSQSWTVRDPLTAAALCSLTVGPLRALEVITGKEAEAVGLLLPWRQADEVEVNTESGLINLWSSTGGILPTFIADYDGDATVIRCLCEPVDPRRGDALVHDYLSFHLLRVGGHYWIGGTEPDDWEYAATDQRVAVDRFRHRTNPPPTGFKAATSGSHHGAY
jgi:hypothetical protein